MQEDIDFAHEMGVRTLVAEPPAEAFDVIEKLCEEYQINLAVHNHPTRSIDAAARSQGLGFLPLQDEQNDFAVPSDHLTRRAVTAFAELLAESEVKAHLKSRGITLTY